MGLEIVGPTPEEMGIKQDMSAAPKKKSFDVADVDRIIAEDPYLSGVWERKQEDDRKFKQDLEKRLNELEVSGMKMAQVIDGLTDIYERQKERPSSALAEASAKYGKQLAYLKWMDNKVTPFLLAEQYLMIVEENLDRVNRQISKTSGCSIEISPLLIKEILDQKQELKEEKKKLQEKISAGRWECTERERAIAKTFGDWRGAEWLDPHLVDFVEEAIKFATGEKKPAEEKEQRRLA